MRLFGSERLMNMFNAMGVPENEQIEHKMLSKAIEKAQMKIETNNYGIRENLLKYDEVMNEQREVNLRRAPPCTGWREYAFRYHEDDHGYRRKRRRYVHL